MREPTTFALLSDLLNGDIEDLKTVLHTFHIERSNEVLRRRFDLNVHTSEELYRCFARLRVAMDESKESGVAVGHTDDELPEHWPKSKAHFLRRHHYAYCRNLTANNITVREWRRAENRHRVQQEDEKARGC